jgi:hypothetical protein
MQVMPLGWILKWLFSCRHWRTPVNEGKCYCPDCGQGVIFQWVVVRCTTCRVRVDSRMLLRQVLPVRRCCPACGERAFRFEYLESPSYFQLHKAQLVVREEQDYLQGRCFHWNLYSVGQTLSRSVEHSLVRTRYWLATAGVSNRRLALLPASVRI